MELRQYQKEIAQKANDILLKLKIVYLCCEVRTGKTLMALETAKLFGANKVLFFWAASSKASKDFTPGARARAYTHYDTFVLRRPDTGIRSRTHTSTPAQQHTRAPKIRVSYT